MEFLFAIPADEREIFRILNDIAPSWVHFLPTRWAGVHAQYRRELPAEIDDVLWCADQLQHLMVARGFEAARLELVAQFTALLALAFVIERGFEFDDEFDGFAESIHHQFLASERLDLGDSQLFLLLEQF